MLNTKNFESFDGNALRGICFYFVIPNKVLLLFWEKATNHIYKLGDIYIYIYILGSLDNFKFEKANFAILRTMKNNSLDIKF